MADTSKYTAYKNQFSKDNYDRVNLTVPKGHKSILQAHAESQSESLNAFINRAANETMDRDANKPR